MGLWYLGLLLPAALVEYGLYTLKPVADYYSSKPIEGLDVSRRYDVDKWNRLKFYIGAYFLLPWRLALMTFSVVADYLVIKLALINWNNQPKPLPKWRRTIIANATRFLSKILLLGAGFWKVEEVGKPSDQACVIASNHCSWVDIIYFLTSPEFPSFVSKDDVEQMPFIGAIATGIQCLFVKRLTGKEQALKQMAARQLSIKNQEGYPKLLVFPEGTTTNGTGLIRFKKGGFVEKVPVQPVYLEYSTGDFSPCLEIVPMVAHVILLACQFSNKLKVHRLETVTAKEDWTSQDYAQHVRNVISHRFDLPQCEVTFEDISDLYYKIFNLEKKIN